VSLNSSFKGTLDELLVAASVDWSAMGSEAWDDGTADDVTPSTLADDMDKLG
jgi:hypothetical protein